MTKVEEALAEADRVIAGKTRSYVFAAIDLAKALKAEHADAEQWKARADDLRQFLRLAEEEAEHWCARALAAEARLRRTDPAYAASSDA